MNTKTLSIGGFAVVIVLGSIACSAERPKTSDSYASSSSSSSSSSSGGTTYSADAGSEEDDASASTTDASQLSDGSPQTEDAGADAAPIPDPPPPPMCAALTSKSGTKLAISTGADRGLSVTPSGLSIAWITLTGGGVVRIHYADRANTASAFGAARTKTAGFAAADRVALTPDGLGLAVVNADRRGFSYLSRDSVDDAFGSPGVGPFSNLNDQGANDWSGTGLTYADPIFARNGAYLIFSRVGGPSSEPTVLVATHFLSTDPFSFGSPFAENGLMPSSAGARKTVTSMSEDLRTLFVWDTAVQKTRTVTLAPDFTVTASADFSTATDVQVNSDCTAAYFISNGDIYQQ